MLNEEKIRLMTKAASYEASSDGKKALSMNKYFRGDYISLNLIWAWISYTIAFCLCAGLWAFYKIDHLMENIHRMDLAAFGKGILFLYLGLLGIFLVIHYLVYLRRYQENRKGLAAYYKILKQISHIYDTEARAGSKALTDEGAGEHDDFTGI